jgi:transposase
VPVGEETSRAELIALLADRDAQLAHRDTRIAAADRQIAALSRQVAELMAAKEELAAKLARLEHLLTRNSGNSSMPPSKDDDPGRTPPAAKPKRPGGGSRSARGKQPGAPGANLAWVANPTRQVDRYPTGRCDCGHDLAGAADLGVVDRYQQHEIPRMSVSITQYDQHQVRCGCGRIHTAGRPEGARSGLVGYGPNLQAFAVYLMVVHFVPVQRCVALLESLTGAAPSVGFVHGMLTRASALLAEVDKRIRALITLAYAVCADETPLRVGSKTPKPGRKKAEKYLLVGLSS